MVRWLVVAGAVVALAAAGCAGERRVGFGSATDGAAERPMASCDGVGTPFPIAALHQEPLSREELRALPFGPAVTSFFETGSGAVESHDFDGAEGFTILAEREGSLLLGGMRDGRVVSDFRLVRKGGSWDVSGWGGCVPRRVEGDLTAAVWYPTQKLRDVQRTINIEVEGGKCVGEPNTTTKVARIDTHEADQTLTVTVWVREPEPESACAGVGLLLPATVELNAPLRHRRLLDGGLVPPGRVDRS
jgi:hypothetical protein